MLAILQVSQRLAGNLSLKCCHPGQGIDYRCWVLLNIYFGVLRSPATQAPVKAVASDSPLLVFLPSIQPRVSNSTLRQSSETKRFLEESQNKKKTRKLAVQTRRPKKKKNTTGDGWLAVALPFAVFVDIEIGTRVGLRWISKDNNTSWVVGLRARGHREKFGIPKNRRMLRFVLLETPVSSCAKFSVGMVFFLFCFLRHEQWTVHCLS